MTTSFIGGRRRKEKINRQHYSFKEEQFPEVEKSRVADSSKISILSFMFFL